MANIPIQVIVTAKDAASSVLKGIGSQASSAGSNFANLQKDALIAAAGITAVGVGAWKIATDAGKFESVSDAFKGMTKGMISDQDAFVKKVQEASKNTISSFDVIQGGTKALALLGKGAFKDFENDFSRMAELSKKAARATGQDVDFMFQSLIVGTARESKLILDNLGITMDLTAAKDAYAASIGKSAEELTIEEGKFAVLQATLDQLDKTYENVAVSSGGFQGAQQQLKATLADLKIELGTELLPVFNELVRAIIPLAKEYIPKVTEAVKKGIEAFMGLPKPVQLIIGGLIVLLPALVALGAILIPLISLFGVIATVIGVLASPIGIIILAVGAFVASIIIMINNLKRFKEEAERVFNSVREKVDSVIGFIRGLIDNFRPKISIGIDLPDIVGAWNRLKEKAHNIGIPGFQEGGIVPGSGLAGVPAVVHPGEMILNKSQQAKLFAMIGQGSGGTTQENHIGQVIIQQPMDLQTVMRGLSFEMKNR